MPVTIRRSHRPDRHKAGNSTLPVSPEEIASGARAAWEAGAGVVHVHLRDAEGRPTADLEVAHRVVGLIEAACPALIQLSTGVGLGVPFEERERLVEAGPAMATLNVCSMTVGDAEFHNPPDGVRRLAAGMRDLGVKPELELYDTGHVEMALALRDEGLLEEPLQFSLVLGVRGGMRGREDRQRHEDQTGDKHRGPRPDPSRTYRVITQIPGARECSAQQEDEHDREDHEDAEQRRRVDRLALVAPEAGVRGRAGMATLGRRARPVVLVVPSGHTSRMALDGLGAKWRAAMRRALLPATLGCVTSPRPPRHPHERAV